MLLHTHLAVRKICCTALIASLPASLGEPGCRAHPQRESEGVAEHAACCNGRYRHWTIPWTCHQGRKAPRVLGRQDCAARQVRRPLSIACKAAALEVISSWWGIISEGYASLSPEGQTPL